MTIGATNFPASLDTLTELIRAVNDGSTTIATGGASNSATTINVVSAASAPSDGKAVIVDAADASIFEIITFTGKTSTTLTGVTRNVEASGAKTWDAGDFVFFDGITALNHNVLAAAIVAIETKLGSGSSTPADGEALIGSGAGTSDWRGITIADVSGLQTAIDGKQPLNASLTAIAALADPNADKMLFWDDSAGSWALLSPGVGLDIGTTTLAVDVQDFVRVVTADGAATTTSNASNSTYQTCLTTTAVLPAGTWNCATHGIVTAGNSSASHGCTARVSSPTTGNAQGVQQGPASVYTAIPCFSQGDVVSNGSTPTTFTTQFRTNTSGTCFTNHNAHTIFAICRRVA